MNTIIVDIPRPGQLARVRDRQWVVVDVRRSGIGERSPSLADAGLQHMVTLAAVDDDRSTGEEIDVIWEIEPAARVIERAELPPLTADTLDDPTRLDAFLDAIRWSAVTSADAQTLQAPFRSGIEIEDFQLDPVVRALRQPRANLLIADDVGLGKTIEAGLVVQELLLRHRARTVLVVCPAPLQRKWQDEMREKFGLDFRIVDTELLRQLRRTRGLHTNPWAHFPRLITSIDWLKRDRPMALLREVLPAVPSLPRRFDLLIVDEVHNAAPTATGKYATDTMRTKAIRTLAPHCEHRLFLSATPHNGYAESFSGLLELLDPQRFARGVKPSPERLAEVMVRRLKTEIENPDGSRRFPVREISALEVEYTDEERSIHADLAAYTASRLRRASERGERARTATNFVLLLLKKRLFSSPAAFASTLAKHRDTTEHGRPQMAAAGPPLSVLLKRIDDVDTEVADEQELEDAIELALEVTSAVEEPLSSDERAMLDRLGTWTERAQHIEDAKATAAFDWIDEVCRPGGEWNDERVIVFTEYRDTHRYLRSRLAARGVPAERIAVLHGAQDKDDREGVKNRFQEAPSMDPVRILLATDAASEGIDLQRHCYRLLHYEIPWNPNRLEQRNGRIDRHGQRHDPVLIRHPVGKGWENAGAGSLEADLQFLAKAAEKVSTIAADLGSVGPVIASQVQEAMLGKRIDLDTRLAEERAPSRRLLKVERDLRAQVLKLRERLDQSRESLQVHPDHVRHVVDVALTLAGQPPLVPADPDEQGRPRYIVPALTGSWAPATIGLEHPVTGQRRPITFDHAAAVDRTDVVLVHLGHRLVTLALALLRAEVWKDGPGARLSRTTIRIADAGEGLEGPVAVAHARLVITGSDGRRLHEELIAAALDLNAGKRTPMGVGRSENVLATATSRVPARPLAKRLLDRVDADSLGEPLLRALERRAADRAESLQRTLEQRSEDDIRTIVSIMEDLARSIELALEDPENEQLALFSDEEREQLRRDTDALQRRLAEIPDDVARESAAIRARYDAPEPRLFPVSVTLVVPEALLGV